MLRGNYGQWIFNDDAHRRRFFKILEERFKKYDFKWSSHLCYMEKQNLTCLYKGYILKHIKKYFSNSEQSYSAFLREHKDHGYGHQYLELDESGQLKYIDDLEKVNNPTTEDDLSLLSIKDIIQIVCKVMDINPKQIASRN